MKWFIYKTYWVLWKVISFLSGIYWFLWRKDQFRRFNSIGSDVHISRNCYFSCESISIGNHVYIGPHGFFQSDKSKIKIGNHVMFGPNVSIHGGNHRTDVIGRYMIDIRLDEKLPENDQDVVIENDVWVGANAIILKGVTIGQGSIIGAGTIVSKSVPPYSIVIGNKPQRIVERWTPEQIIQHKTQLGYQS